MLLRLEGGEAEVRVDLRKRGESLRWVGTAREEDENGGREGLTTSISLGKMFLASFVAIEGWTLEG